MQSPLQIDAMRCGRGMARILLDKETSKQAIGTASSCWYLAEAKGRGGESGVEAARDSSGIAEKALGRGTSSGRFHCDRYLGLPGRGIGTKYLSCIPCWATTAVAELGSTFTVHCASPRDVA